MPRLGGPSGGLAQPSRWPTVRARARRGAVIAVEASAVAQAARAHRRLPCGRVRGTGTRGGERVHRARGIATRLTEEVGRR
jgi:hypothetical protein